MPKEELRALRIRRIRLSDPFEQDKALREYYVHELN